MAEPEQLGLSGRALRTAGNDEVGQREIGFEPARRLVEHGARNAVLLGFRPQIGEPARERGIGGARMIREQGGACRRDRHEKECPPPFACQHAAYPRTSFEHWGNRHESETERGR